MPYTPYRPVSRLRDVPLDAFTGALEHELDRL